jgi:alkylhydroperoxidase/carboxymuconolactone decarboxylase family protein YurZ
MVTLAEIQAQAAAFIEAATDGPALSRLTAALIALGVRASVTCLDASAIRDAIAAAIEAGATVTQTQEVLILVSGLGVHSLMVGLHLAEPASVPAPRTEEQAGLWQRFVGDDPYWAGFETEFPGFLESMLRVSPDLFRAFFSYCAVPWEMGTVDGLTKELIALATDACPTHRFGPGLRLHLRNAIKLGAGRTAILQTLEIAAAAPGHRGIG